jgi:signal transduction histidine kinase
MGSDFYKHRNERYMGEKFTSRSITVLVCCFAVALSFILCALWGEIQFFLIIAVISFLIVCVNEIRNIRDFANLVKLSKQIDSMGEDKPFEETIPESSAVYAESEKLINLSQKMSVSLEEQLKSERLKIELVANVSHDLKTPLTSIISYIDLLKKLDLDDEAKSYVQIIDKKSQKLKGIVADVFAIAKASSGIEVDLTEIDFVMLFNQAFADAYDKIEAVGLTVKTSIEIDSACVMADGDKLYRVFQNLIDNALNYSLKGSRIFMTVKRDGENAVFISKNISASPIDFTADEITERFVRGDKNRTDGGSGLGLSIAKSFTEACGGSFEITLDGDTFITTVTMPIYKK